MQICDDPATPMTREQERRLLVFLLDQPSEKLVAWGFNEQILLRRLAEMEGLG